MCEGYSSTPIELATKVKDLGDLLNILEEFIEIPVSAKLDKLSVMMEINNEEDTKEAFQKLLSSLPKDLVRANKCFFLQNLNSFQVNTSTVRGYGTLLQRAVNVTDEERLRFGKEDFVRILLDFGFVCILMPFFKYFSIASLALTPTALIGAWRYDALDRMSNIS